MGDQTVQLDRRRPTYLVTQRTNAGSMLRPKELQICLARLHSFAVNLLDHVSISVSDLEVAAVFYDAIMTELRAKKVYHLPEAIGYGERCDNGNIHNSYLSIYLSENTNTDARRHWCFKAETRAQVDAFYSTGIRHGGMSDGSPGLRTQYHASYYAAFLLDPFGNRIEAVCHS